MTSCWCLQAATAGMRQRGTDDRELYGTETQSSNRTLRGISSGTFLNLIMASHLYFFFFYWECAFYKLDSEGCRP